MKTKQVVWRKVSKWTKIKTKKKLQPGTRETLRESEDLESKYGPKHSQILKERGTVITTRRRCWGFRCSMSYMWSVQTLLSAELKAEGLVPATFSKSCPKCKHECRAKVSINWKHRTEPAEQTGSVDHTASLGPKETPTVMKQPWHTLCTDVLHIMSVLSMLHYITTVLIQKAL